MKKENNKTRPPVVVIMGHVDHGKSTLLDYIRKTKVVEQEKGGITQRISAYAVTCKDENGKTKKITFLDTPGHEAFSKMRERGAKVADIAILVVSAEEGVKPQTLEAWKEIETSKIPCLVAINKIDKPGANIEKTKLNLLENSIVLESYGGKIPSVEISAKTGAGIDNLLSLVNLIAEMENLTGDTERSASGFVIESSLDPKRGIQASLIIKNGSLKRGMIIVAQDAICSSRIIENFLGETISEASFSDPILVVGFDKIPPTGSEFICFEKKSEAEKYIEKLKSSPEKTKPLQEVLNKEKKIIPIVLKTDVLGSLEAIEKEISKIKNENTEFKIIQKGTGPISESDIKKISATNNAIVIGFNVKSDKGAIALAEKLGISILFFEIIYKVTEWLASELEKRKEKIKTPEINGRAKILKTFSRTKERQIAGGKVISGYIPISEKVKIIRREAEIGQGKILNLEKNKAKVSEVKENEEFGLMIESKIELAQGDVIESFSIVEK
jgi:translation initiation factor IF-2